MGIIILNKKTKSKRIKYKKMLFNIANRVNRNTNASRPAVGGSRGLNAHRYTNEIRVPRDEPVYTNPPLLSIDEVLRLAAIEENANENAEIKFGESLQEDTINTNILSDTIFE